MDLNLSMDERARFQHQLRLQQNPMMYDYPSQPHHARSASAGPSNTSNPMYGYGSHPQHQQNGGLGPGHTNGNGHAHGHPHGSMAQSFYPFGGQPGYSLPSHHQESQHPAQNHHRGFRNDRAHHTGSLDNPPSNWLGLPPNQSGSMAMTLNGGLPTSPQVFTPGGDDFDMKPDPDAASWINDGFDELEGGVTSGEDERNRTMERHGSSSFFGIPDSPFGNGYAGNSRTGGVGSTLNMPSGMGMVGIMPPRRKSADALMGMSTTYTNEATYDNADILDNEDTTAFDDLIMAEAEAEEEEVGAVAGGPTGAVGDRTDGAGRLEKGAVQPMNRTDDGGRAQYVPAFNPDYASSVPTSAASSAFSNPSLIPPSSTSVPPPKRNPSKSKPARPPPPSHATSAQSTQSIPPPANPPPSSSNIMHRSIDDLLVRFWTHQMEIAESGAEPEAMDARNGINGAGGDGVAGPSFVKSKPALASGQDRHEGSTTSGEAGGDGLTVKQDEFKSFTLPLARIKKVMKSDPDVKMISAEVPVLLAKACEIFIGELTCRAWLVAESYKRRTLQKSDVAAAIGYSDMFDFLIDIVPREEAASKHDLAQKKRNAKAKERRDEVKERDKERERVRAEQRARERDAEDELEEDPRRKQARVGPNEDAGGVSHQHPPPSNFIGLPGPASNGHATVDTMVARATTQASARPPRSSSAPPSQSVRPEAPPPGIKVKAEVGG